MNTFGYSDAEVETILRAFYVAKAMGRPAVRITGLRRDYGPLAWDRRDTGGVESVDFILQCVAESSGPHSVLSLPWPAYITEVG
jgi:hypothetical protein